MRPCRKLQKHLECLNTGYKFNPHLIANSAVASKTIDIMRDGFDFDLEKKVQVSNDQEKSQSERRFPLQIPKWERN